MVPQVKVLMTFVGGMLDVLSKDFHLTSYACSCKDPISFRAGVRTLHWKCPMKIAQRSTKVVDAASVALF